MPASDGGDGHAEARVARKERERAAQGRCEEGPPCPERHPGAEPSEAATTENGRAEARVAREERERVAKKAAQMRAVLALSSKGERDASRQRRAHEGAPVAREER